MENSLPVAVEATLLELEEQRKQIVKSKISTYSCGIGAFLMIIPAIFAPYPPMVWIGIALILLALSFYFGYGLSDRISHYRYAFKIDILSSFLKNIDPSITFDPAKGVSEFEFIRTCLFHKRPDRFHSEDQFCGSAGATDFCFSEAHAEYKTEVRTKNGRSEHWHDIFKGIIFTADFNKHFSGITVVRPRDTGASISAWLAKHLPVLSSSAEELVQLENPEFCKEFVTWSNDQVEARYILTPALMDRICQLNALCRNTVSISFIDRYMYLAFPLNHDYFEPPVYKSLLKGNPVAADLEIIQFMYDIVSKLDLNTRIWGK